MEFCTCAITAYTRSQNLHPSNTPDPLFMQVRAELDAAMAKMILELMGSGLAHDRDTWIARQAENLDDELRELLLQVTDHREDDRDD